MSEINAISISTVRGDETVIELSPELKKCYVTRDHRTRPYTFGGRLILGLTEETFAHFILRSKKDETHQGIMARENALHPLITEAVLEVEKLNLRTLALGKDHGFPPTTLDDIVEIQSRLIKLDNDYATLMVEKGQSGLRILQQMKKDFQEKGTL